MTSSLRDLLMTPGPAFLLEAHNAVSAQIVEEAGFRGIWASSLTLSTSLGCRDNNELSMTEVLGVLEAMTDRVSVPVLFDGDTGYGSFNHFQRLVRKLGQRQVAGVCIEDKVFPKTNSFVRSEQQRLAPIEEFCGKLRAGRDATTDDNFVIVARTEALITGLGMDEALERAHRYADAGANAILVHSKAPTIDEISRFMAQWGRPIPIVCVPTTYYSTSRETFEAIGVSVVIWANHLLRSAITAMQEVATQLCAEGNARRVEDRIAPVKELFRLQDEAALELAERTYNAPDVASLIVLAASRGAALGGLTADKPKCMVSISGEPLIAKLIGAFRAEGVRTVSVVRGYAKEQLVVPGAMFFDNDEWETTGELHSLATARRAMRGDFVIAYGDLVLKRYIVHELLSSTAPLTIVVDTSKRFRSRQDVDKVKLVGPVPAPYEDRMCSLQEISTRMDETDADGEWIGLLYARGTGVERVCGALEQLTHGPEGRRAWMGDLMNHILKHGDTAIRVIAIQGDWIDVDSLADLAEERAS